MSLRVIRFLIFFLLIGFDSINMETFMNLLYFAFEQIVEIIS